MHLPHGQEECITQRNKEIGLNWSGHPDTVGCAIMIRDREIPKLGR